MNDVRLVTVRSGGEIYIHAFIYIYFYIFILNLHSFIYKALTGEYRGYIGSILNNILDSVISILLRLRRYLAWIFALILSWFTFSYGSYNLMQSVGTNSLEEPAHRPRYRAMNFN